MEAYIVKKKKLKFVKLNQTCISCTSLIKFMKLI